MLDTIFAADWQAGSSRPHNRLHGWHSVRYNPCFMDKRVEEQEKPDRRRFLRRALHRVLPWLAGAATGRVLPVPTEDVAALPAAPAATEPMPEAVKRELDAQFEEFSRDNPEYGRRVDS